VCQHGILKGYSALHILAKQSGYNDFGCIDVVDKAILLLNRNARISCRDDEGNTVLHTVLKTKRFHERRCKSHSRSHGNLFTWYTSVEAPKDILRVFLTAGADIHAINNAGETPSMIATKYGREAEWIEALQFCGYEHEKLCSCCTHTIEEERQTPKLSLQEYCQQRKSMRHISTFEEMKSGYRHGDI